MTDEQILRKAIEKATKNSNIIFLAQRLAPYQLIFSHSFAKAFFGTMEQARHIRGICIEDSIPVWKIALQQMVLEPQPLKYLERFL